MRAPTKSVDRDWCGAACPIQPHELDGPLRRGMDDLVRKVVARSLFEGDGRDIFLRVYMAGMYHATEIANDRR